MLVLIWVVFLTLPSASAEPGKPSPALAAGPAPYDSFRLIHTRNVFDPDRRPIRPLGNAPVASAPTLADYAALTGTMLSVEKAYAFFSGSRSAFDKVLSVHDQFANATIVDITAQSIEIERDGKRTTILIGQTVPFDNQTAPGEPPVEAPPADTTAGGAPNYRPATVAPSFYRPATAVGTPAAPKGPPGNVDEIRRRMMEKRQQELK